MNELAVKASNGTNSVDDREYIQNEIDQLVTEIDRVSQTTKFNETYMLQGDAAGIVTGTSTAELSSATAVGTDGTSVATGVKAEIAEGAELTAGSITLGTVTVTTDTGNLDVTALSGELKTALEAADDADVTLTHATNGSGEHVWKIGTGSAQYTASQLKDMGLNVGGADGDITLTKAFEVNDKTPAGVTVDATGTLDLTNLAIGQEIKATLTAERNSNNVNEISIAAYDPTYVPAALKFDLQVGADTTSANKIQLEISSMSTTSLGLVDANGRLLVNGDGSTNADKAVDTIAAALQKVSTQRSALGAVQNRLEHTINNLDNVVENTTAAESQIRDTDMATEMVKYSNNNILTQAGQAMLAQSNQANQGVLSLLQ